MQLLLLCYFQLASTKKPVELKQLETASGASLNIIKALVDKHIFELYHVQTDRISLKGKTNELKFENISGTICKTNVDIDAKAKIFINNNAFWMKKKNDF